jgi:hypothetical protein
MHIVTAVSLFAAGIVLLMVSANFWARRLSNVPRQRQDSARIKGVLLGIAGGMMAIAGVVVLFVPTILFR